MNAEQAWDHFVQQVMNVAGGIEQPERAVAAGKLYAAHAVAEARAPLVAALEASCGVMGLAATRLDCDGVYSLMSEALHETASKGRAALAKETP